ncbi:hypothetical protein HDU83_007172 [Entophlyctis luteolus]|nr:hypothetical protein HDU83_007172 [Entophlyctis luteolus]
MDSVTRVIPDPQKRRVGRKPGAIPTSDKGRRNLEAQRAFRERQRLRIEALEARIKELEADSAASAFSAKNRTVPHAVQLAITSEEAIVRSSGIAIDFTATLQKSGVGCPECAVEKARTLVALGQLSKSQTRITELEAQLQEIQNQSSSPAAYNSSNNSSKVDQDTTTKIPEPPLKDENFDKKISITPNDALQPISSTQDVGPLGSFDLGMVAIELLRSELNAIPSLTNCAFIDLLLDSLKGMRNASTKAQFLECRVKVLLLRGKILDMCNLYEWQKTLQILGWVMFFNLSALKTKVLAFLQEEEMITEQVERRERFQKLSELDKKHGGRVMAVRSVILNSPSLHDKHDLVDTFLLAVWTKLVTGKSTDKLKLCLRALWTFSEMKCMDDFVQMSLALEMIRQGNRGAYDEVYAEVGTFL